MKPRTLSDGSVLANHWTPYYGGQALAAKIMGCNSSKAAFVTYILRLYPSGAKPFIEPSSLELRVGVLPILAGALLFFRFIGISDQICCNSRLYQIRL
jgi:hypothetical protein